MNPSLVEQLEILRRIAERGLAASVPMGSDFGNSDMVDIFQHLLDEIERTKKYASVS